MGGKKAFIYTDRYFQYDYGPYHPLRVERLKLAYELIKSYGLLELPDALVLETEPATLGDIISHHRPEYIDTLRRCSRGDQDYEAAAACGLGAGDNPIFNGLWEWSLLTTGASLQGAKLLADGTVDMAFSIAGGLHHAFSRKASGFCYINDIAVAIKALIERGLRVVYVDIDAHHGDGVQDAFYDTDQVLTISIHQHGHSLFPGTGFVYETGRGKGQGYSVNMPLYPGTDDDIFMRVFGNLVPDLIHAFKPDVLVSQLGVDTMKTDPLTNLAMTTNGYMAAVTMLRDLGLPWLALGGGGYHIVNVARAWTLTWAMVNNVEPPDELPESFLEMIRPKGYRESRLRDKPRQVDSTYKKDANSVARNIIEAVRETILPVIAHNAERLKKVG